MWPGLLSGGQDWCLLLFWRSHLESDGQKYCSVGQDLCFVGQDLWSIGQDLCFVGLHLCYVGLDSVPLDRTFVVLADPCVLFAGICDMLAGTCVLLARNCVILEKGLFLCLPELVLCWPGLVFCWQALVLGCSGFVVYWSELCLFARNGILLASSCVWCLVATRGRTTSPAAVAGHAKQLLFPPRLHMIPGYMAMQSSTINHTDVTQLTRNIKMLRTTGHASHANRKLKPFVLNSQQGMWIVMNF